MSHRQIVNFINKFLPLSEFEVHSEHQIPEKRVKKRRSSRNVKGIHPAISPDLLKVLAEMGHGDELVLSDAHFLLTLFIKNVIRADGLSVATLLEGISALFEFDQYVEAPLAMMQAVKGDTLDPSVEERYLNAIKKVNGTAPKIERVERFAFL